MSGRAASIGWGLLLAAALVGCTNPERRSESSVAGSPIELRWRPVDDVVECDGTERFIGSVEQAQPGESIAFATPMPVDVAPGRADDEGLHRLNWICQPEEAQLRWDLTATGSISDRSVEFTLVGAPPSVESAALVADLYTDDLVCDGTRHRVGVLTGLAPGERVSFESERSGASAEPRADDDGAVEIGWRCRPGDIGERWSVTALAPESDRSTSFRLSGLAPADDPALAVESAASEVPCDDAVHPLGTLVNLFPLEVVTFAAPGAEGLIDGRATGDGRLDLRWDCDRGDVGTTWELTATGTESAKTATITFTGIAGQPPEPLVARLVEERFACDGERRPVAELDGLQDGEFVDFTSPQAGPLREGRAEGERLTIHWQCGPAQAGTVWEITATGRESGRSVTVTVTGIAPSP